MYSKFSVTETTVKMRNIVLATFLLLYAGFTVSAKVSKNVAIMVELPTKDRNQEIDELSDYVRFVISNTQVDHKLSFTVIDNEIVTIFNFKCIDVKCRLNAIKQLDELKNQRVKVTGIAKKKLLVQYLKELDSKTFTAENGHNEDAEKIVLLVLSSPEQNDIPISDFTKSLLENNYKIIAVGIGDGNTENLRRIVIEDNRVAYANDFGDLNDNSTKDMLKELIDNPNYRDPSTPKITDEESSSYLSAANEYVPAEEICTYAVDIAFIVDSSFSIKLDYRKELLFVQRVANRFGITETGTHAGVILFSDEENYTRVTIKLNDFKNTKDFNEAVAKSPFIGYRTRIDYAFQKAEQELFTIEGGARPSMTKIIFLITDGYQNPTKDSISKKPYDPVAASQSLYDDGVKIFVVGIGQDLNPQQLETIARDKSKVYYAKTIETLISDDFVKSVSKKLCAGGKLQRNISTTSQPQSFDTTKSQVQKSNIPTTSQPQNFDTKKSPGEKCGGVGACSRCCGLKDVYVNIFYQNSGPSYVMQGMKLSSGSSLALSGHETSGMKPAIDLKKNIDPKYVMEILKKVIPERPEVIASIQSLLENKHTPVQSDWNTTHRKRRDITSMGRSFNDTKLMELARLAGCNLFFKALDKYNMLNQLIMKKNVIFFCPIDPVFKRMHQQNSFSIGEKQLLLNHVAFSHDHDQMRYRTLSKDGKIILTKGYDYARRPTWYANDVPVVLSIADGNNKKIILIKDFIKPRLNDTQSILKTDSNLSIFYDLWQRSSVLHNLDTRWIQKICFTETLCTSVTKALQDHLHKALRFQQFTILAPTNDVFFKMDQKYFKSIYKNESAMREFMQEHIYLGLIGQQNVQGQLSHSISPKHSIITTGIHDNNMVLIDVQNRLLKVEGSVPVKEGILHVIKTVE